MRINLDPAAKTGSDSRPIDVETELLHGGLVWCFRRTLSTYEQRLCRPEGARLGLASPSHVCSTRRSLAIAKDLASTLRIYLYKTKEMLSGKPAGQFA